ncbi:hypothetical protein [Micromonospora psammae]|uniref:hypothetical protein n=1 Tax=Micromonospora sp. CPCC 205556 TaxID=3122398 RepID=UPI002FF09A35
MNFRRSDRPGDRAESERLLDATGAGATPAGAADPLAQLLSAAAAPPRPGELAGEQAALAAFRAARASGAVAPVAPPGRRRGLTTGVVAWIAGIAATATAGAAFAAVTLDRPAEPERPPRPSAPAPTTPDRSTPSSGGSTSGGSTSGAPSGAPSGTPGAVPSATTTAGGPAGGGKPDKPSKNGKLSGKCRAYLAKSPRNREKALRTPGFADLVAAAGGAERVEAYCRELLTEPAPAASSDPQAAPSSPAPTPDAKPSKKKK